MLSRVVEVEELTWTERREASFLKVLEASWLQAPNDSTTRGMQLQPSSSQIPEFACIFRCSVAKAAEPAVCPASELCQVLAETTQISRTQRAGLPLMPQLLTSMSAGLDCFWSWPRPLPASSVGLYKALLKR